MTLDLISVRCYIIEHANNIEEEVWVVVNNPVQMVLLKAGRLGMMMILGVL
jgi:hypothetical protein